MATQRINITLGTAGHIDHGKTMLTKMLTGCETDLLREEKERGMSIELGFAPCAIANMEVGIVDVPGHENFVKTMVAGASGMDGVMLIVAADDGVMPQTREHLDILTLLGIRYGLVALTKIDRVKPERREAVGQQVRALLAGTFLAEAPILPVSNITGEGYPGFLEALSDMVRSIRPRSTDGVFRQPVERTFSAKGYGTVITGIPLSGSIRTGDEVVLLPQGLSGRIASMEVYGQPSDQALAGQCAALQLRHWDRRLIKRGNTVTVPGYFAPAQWYVCKMHLLANEQFTLKNASQLKFHTGTSEVTASVYLMEGQTAGAGQECLVQMKLAEPLVGGPGDFFIVRTLSPVRTVGGGRILEAVPRRLKRTRPGLLADLQERSEAVRRADTFVEYCIKHTDGWAVSEEQVSVRAKVPRKLVQQITNELAAQDKVIRLAEGLIIHRETTERMETIVRDTVAGHHRGAPQSPGMTLEQLAAELELPKGLAKTLSELLKTRGTVVERSGRLALPAHRETFDGEQRKLLEAVESLFREQPFSPPSIEQAAEAAAASVEQAENIIKVLLEHGRLVQVNKSLFFHSQAIARARQLIESHIREEGRLESVKFKYLLETTRKFAIPLLDYFDRVGVTQRVGYTRYLRR